MKNKNERKINIFIKLWKNLDPPQPNILNLRI